MYHLARLAVLGIAIGLVGCSKNDAPSYANVSGTVTYNGNPLDKGQITFSTDGRPPTAMDIIDGKFSGQAMIGSNKIAVSAYRKGNTQKKMTVTASKMMQAYRGKGNPGGANSESIDASMEDYIPPEWGRDSKHFRVVEAGSQNNFQFDIRGSK
jgi:hypothetical protein